MNKRVFGTKLSRERSSRELLFVSLVEGLILHGRIKTTKAKAKAIVGLVDRLVTLAKKDTLASKRQILKRLKNNKTAAFTLWNNIAKTFADRAGGFTRIVPLVARKGDLADMVRLEWIEEVKKEERNDKSEKKTKTKKDQSLKS